MRGHFWLNLFLVMVGVVVGSMAAEMTVGIPWLKWLSYGLEFGTESPVVLDLNLLRLTDRIKEVYRCVYCETKAN